MPLSFAARIRMILDDMAVRDDEPVLEDDAAGDHIRGLYADDPVHPGAYRFRSVASCRRKRTWHHLRRTEHGENCAQGHRAPDERIMMQDLFHVFILRRTPPRRKMPIRRVRPYAGIWGSHPSGRSAYVPASMSVPPRCRHARRCPRDWLFPADHRQDRKARPMARHHRVKRHSRVCRLRTRGARAKP